MSSKAQQIVHGPSKEELFDSLRLLREKRFVEFVCKGEIVGRACKITRACRITGIKAEDGSGESWLLDGYCDGDSRKFAAYYRTDKRAGRWH